MPFPARFTASAGNRTGSAGKVQMTPMQAGGTRRRTPRHRPAGTR